MTTYDFIIEGIRFSYSSVSTFDTCPYSFKLIYIDAIPRGVGNFFSQYGSFVHECFEKFFMDKLESYELSDYYMDNYNDKVTMPPPPNPPGMAEKYKEQGLTFFNNFSFPREDYEVIAVENRIDFEMDGIMLVAKPDLIIRNIKTQKVSLFDYKTATPYRIDKRSGAEIADASRIAGYHKQLYIYTYAIRNHMGIPIDEITLWYPRLNKVVTEVWNQAEEDSAIKWLTDAINKIRTEEDFPYNNSNNYFCGNLCNAKSFCEYG